jgi:hypothetical protein
MKYVWEVYVNESLSKYRTYRAYRYDHIPHRFSVFFSATSVFVSSSAGYKLVKKESRGTACTFNGIQHLCSPLSHVVADVLSGPGHIRLHEVLEQSTYFLWSYSLTDRLSSPFSSTFKNIMEYPHDIIVTPGIRITSFLMNA